MRANSISKVHSEEHVGLSQTQVVSTKPPPFRGQLSQIDEKTFEQTYTNDIQQNNNGGAQKEELFTFQKFAGRLS